MTEAELREAQRLRAIYESKKKELRMTQERLAGLMGFTTQGAVSQYLRGIIAMNNETLLRFAYHLDFDPREVRPDIFKQMPFPSAPLNEDIPQDAIRWARRLARLSEADQAMVERFLDALDRPNH